jgi:hypothetical protein
MLEKLFIYDITPSDELYRVIRDEKRPEVVNLKNYMEHLWEIYYPYADKDFRSQLPHDLHARFWEMYLTCTLINKAFNIVPKLKRSKGPDILIEESSRRIFIEATAPSEGYNNNPDKVPKLKSNEATRVPDTEILLRYSGAIADKYKKYHTYLNQSIISPGDSYVIALNSCKIDTAIIDQPTTNDIPRIMKAILPIGNKQVQISKPPAQVVNWTYQYRPNIHRKSGSAVPTDLFLRPEYSSLSGIIYSRSDVANHSKQMGDDLTFIHNPKSTQNGVPRGYFKFGTEYFVTLNNDGSTISWDRQDWH